MYTVKFNVAAIFVKFDILVHMTNYSLLVPLKSPNICAAGRGILIGLSFIKPFITIEDQKTTPF